MEEGTIHHDRDLYCLMSGKVVQSGYKLLEEEVQEKQAPSYSDIQNTTKRSIPLGKRGNRNKRQRGTSSDPIRRRVRPHLQYSENVLTEVQRSQCKKVTKKLLCWKKKENESNVLALEGMYRLGKMNALAVYRTSARNGVLPLLGAVDGAFSNRIPKKLREVENANEEYLIDYYATLVETFVRAIFLHKRNHNFMVHRLAIGALFLLKHPFTIPGTGFMLVQDPFLQEHLPEGPMLSYIHSTYHPQDITRGKNTINENLCKASSEICSRLVSEIRATLEKNEQTHFLLSLDQHRTLQE